MLSRSERERYVVDAIKALPPRLMRTIILVQVERRSTEEVAALEGISAERVGRQMIDALVRVRRHLIKHGISLVDSEPQ